MGSKLSVDGMIKTAEGCMGWPYVRPGTNDANGIDCSGLFVRMYRDQGAKIAHGSNSIFHEYCRETGKITSASQLRRGMAVFKILTWTDSEDDRKNKWYGKEPGNLSHIGIVASVNPLRIIHASSVAGCVTTDTKIGKWAWWGLLKDADYGAEGGTGNTAAQIPEATPAEEQEERHMRAYVTTDNGKGSKIRNKPSRKEGLYWDMAEGAEIDITRTGIYQNGYEWSYGTGVDTKGQTVTGYILSNTIRIADGTESPAEDNVPAAEDNAPAAEVPAPAPAEDEYFTIRLTNAEAAEWLRMLDFLNGMSYSVISSMAEKLEKTVGRG